MKLFAPDESSPPPQFQAFDFFFCWGPDRISRTISLATSRLIAPRGLRYAPCHVAFCVMSGQTPLWAESTALCVHPCLYHDRAVDGCQVHLPEERIRDYLLSEGRVDVYRLVPGWELTLAESRLLTNLVIGDYVARDIRYDVDGAVMSGLRVFKLLDLLVGTGLFPRANLHRLFCSEWAANLAMRLGRLPLGNCSKYSPGELGRQLMLNGLVQHVRRYDSQADDLQFDEYMAAVTRRDEIGSQIRSKA